MFTAEQFVERRDELPDGGRWTELHAGEIVTLSSPDAEHGNVVLNLTKAMAACAKPDRVGYACFELGLIVQRRPDTVWCPAISYYTSGPAFAEADKAISDVRPALVVELASSNDRRRDLQERIQKWLQWGVTTVWVIDPINQLVYAIAPPRDPKQLRNDDTLEGGVIIPGLSIQVSDLFKPPSWWK
jgi:Uma2 family endonuclease